MKIGIISDSHDNIWRLDDAIPHLQKTELILHCGDLISPFMVHQLAKKLENIPIHLVWGNNDGDKSLVTKIAQSYPGFTIHGEFAEINLDGFRIAMIHYPEIAKSMALSGRYELVCYGHDHTAHQELIGSTLLVNPGEMMGLFGRSTLAILDTDTLRVELMEVWREMP